MPDVVVKFTSHAPLLVLARVVDSLQEATNDLMIPAAPSHGFSEQQEGTRLSQHSDRSDDKNFSNIQGECFPDDETLTSACIGEDLSRERYELFSNCKAQEVKIAMKVEVLHDGVFVECDCSRCEAQSDCSLFHGEALGK